tara:strand:- start:71833 stop:72204 length:372 start_codon:yes stop_codon:yes gene_type:complete
MKTSLAIVFCYGIFHLFIIFQIIPFNIVWGGRIRSIETILIFEGIALLIMSFLGVVLAMKNRIVKPIFKDKTIKRILLIFAVFFILNTIGNLLAETNIEKIQAVLTLYLTIVLFKASKQKQSL